MFDSQVMEPYYPFKNGSVEDFTIGSENCDNKIGYCNGPLKSGSTYRVKVRAFTAPDKFTDTSYSFPIQTGENDRAKTLTFVRLSDVRNLSGYVILPPSLRMYLSLTLSRVPYSLVSNSTKFEIQIRD